MDFASPLSDLVKCLWGLASTHLCYIYNLKRDVNKLRTETEGFIAKRDDVKAGVESEEERGGVHRTKEVVNWLGKVQIFLGKADQVLQDASERDRIKCLGHCLPQNCWSGYQLGKTVDHMLSEARELEKEVFKTTLPLPPPVVLAMPMVETMGLDSSFNEVWKWLVEEREIGVIGLYGTGGVGKTILMKRINNNFLRANHGFEVVIWVVVSRQVNEDNIRDAIRKRLNIKDEIWVGWSSDQRIHHLLEVLSHKKFVLLIDDVWKELDLSKIGVLDSCPRNGSKVVFTTRSEIVCHQMKANKAYPVQCLTLDEAWGLFENNVGRSTVHSHPKIPELAENIVLECKGLPLALVTIGKAMAGKDDPGEWRDALAVLKSKPHELSGMEEVYHILELSYDSLSDATRQACFLYCCCFPKDYPIMRNELIELWIGQGLLGDIDDVYRMRDKGASILGDLKRACLLESGFDLCGQPIVKMQNVIRDMATWIAHGYGQRESKLLVIEDEEHMSARMISKWEAEKVSLWGSLIANINQTPPMCSPLKTLFIRETKVRLVPRGFFKSMTVSLKVLDLSDNKNIESFPEEICNLISLQYLNLSNTHISELPGEIKNLTQLRWLLFNNSILDGIVLIPPEAIASLPLNVFSTCGRGLENEEEAVEILRYKQDLTDLSITVQKSSSALKIFQSLQRCIRRVWINGCEDLTCIPISHSLKKDNNFSHLEVLCLQNCPLLMKMEITQEKGQENCPSLMKTEITQEKGQALNFSCFPSLIEVSVDNCGFSDLSWLVYAPKLRKLYVRFCPLMEKIIGDEFARAELAASGLFPLLEIISIYGLPNLRSICERTLSFLPGMEFYIRGCPGLRKLPLDSNSERGSFSIEGDRDWWAKFEWDPAARVTLEVDDGSPAMTFEEALGKIKDGDLFMVKIGFPPLEPSMRG